MAIVWNNRNDRFNPNGGNGRGSFEEHNDRMRGFRRSHADVATVNTPRCDESALLGRTRPLQVRRTMMETGGSRLLNGTSDWSVLVHIRRLTLRKFSQN